MPQSVLTNAWIAAAIRKQEYPVRHFLLSVALIVPLSAGLAKAADVGIDDHTDLLARCGTIYQAMSEDPAPDISDSDRKFMTAGAKLLLAKADADLDHLGYGEPDRAAIAARYLMAARQSIDDPITFLGVDPNACMTELKTIAGL